MQRNSITGDAPGVYEPFKVRSPPRTSCHCKSLCSPFPSASLTNAYVGGGAELVLVPVGRTPGPRVDRTRVLRRDRNARSEGDRE